MAKGGFLDRFRRRKKPEPPRVNRGLEQLRQLTEELHAQNEAARAERVKTQNENPIMRDTEVPRIEGGRRINPFIEKYGFPKLKKQEGGEVQLFDPDADKKVWYTKPDPIGALGNFAGDVAEHFPQGLRSQWMGLDDKGVPRGALYSDWDAPKDQWQFNSEAQMLLPPTRSVRPGIVDETIALPAFFGVGPEASFSASDRVQALDEALRGDYGVEPPESWGDYIGEAGGVMSAQVPLPGGMLKGPIGALGKHVPSFLKNSRAARLVGKTLGGIPEWFMPTIEPSLSNYATGTAAGAVLTKYLPEVIARMQGEPEGDIDWNDPNLDTLITEALESGELSPEDAELLRSEIASQGDTLEAPEDEEPEMTTGGGFAKGGRARWGSITATHLGEAARRIQEGESIAQIADTMGVKYSTLYKQLVRKGLVETTPIPQNRLTPEQRAEAVLRNQAGEAQYKLADELGVTQSAISLLKKRMGEIEGHAKGGRIKPTATATKTLRERIAELMSEAKVEGTGREMVPVDPPMTETNLPAPDEFVLPEGVPPAPDTNLPGRTGTVSRRDILRGMASMASPVKLDPLSMLDLNLEGLGKTVKATPVAAAAKALSLPEIASKLQEIANVVLVDTDLPSWQNAAKYLRDLGETGLADELERAKESVLEDGSYEFPYDKFDDELGRIADEKGILRVDPNDGETSLYAEPPNTVSRNGLLDGMMASFKEFPDYADEPLNIEGWEKMIEDWGPRKDAIVADFFGRPTEKPNPKYFGPEVLKKYGLGEHDLDAFIEYLEGEMVDHGNIIAWGNAEPELREKYHDLADQYDALSGDPDADSKIDGLYEQISGVLDEIYGRDGDVGVDPHVYVEPFNLPVNEVLQRYVPEESWGAWTPKQHEQFAKLIKEYQAIYRLGDEAHTPAVQRRAEKIVNQLDALGFDSEGFGSDIG